MNVFRPQLSHTTNFLRNAPLLEELTGVLLPRLWPRGAADLRVLCYGGSIGCEALSLLIALRTFGPAGPASLRATVLSADFSTAVTAFGREGRYTAENFEPLFGMEGGMPAAMRERWFDPEDGPVWKARTELQDDVNFRTLDLLDEPLAEEFDLIVCHNVLTHLQPTSAAVLLERLLARAKTRAVFVCSGVDLDLKAEIVAAGFQPWTGRLEEIHEAFATHRMHYRQSRGQHYFELEDIDRSRPDWPARYSTLFYRGPVESRSHPAPGDQF